jgi:hypothetical protein
LDSAALPGGGREKKPGERTSASRPRSDHPRVRQGGFDWPRGRMHGVGGKSRWTSSNDALRGPASSAGLPMARNSWIPCALMDQVA